MKPLFFWRLVSLMMVATSAVAATGPLTSKDESIFFTTKIHRFAEPIKVTDTTDKGGTLIITDGPGTRSIKFERFPVGKSPLAPAVQGQVDEPYLKEVMKQVRARDYGATTGLTLRATKQETILDVYGTPNLLVVDELGDARGRMVLRGYVVFVSPSGASAVAVQYDSSGIEYAGSKRYDLCADVLQWIAKNNKVQD